MTIATFSKWLLTSGGTSQLHLKEERKESAKSSQVKSTLLRSNQKAPDDNEHSVKRISEKIICEESEVKRIL